MNGLNQHNLCRLILFPFGCAPRCGIDPDQIAGVKQKIAGNPLEIARDQCLRLQQAQMRQ
jgi:hypothetical protein